MASDAPLRDTRLPSHEQVTALLEPEFARAGYEVEEVRVDSSVQPARIVVVADGDRSPDLEALAALSRSAAERLDALDLTDDTSPYVLEVTSPGVDRPLITARHFERARGRKVEVTLTDGERLLARLGPRNGDTVALVIAGARHGEYSLRDVALDDLAKAVVQVEFSTPNRRELELAGGAPDDKGRESQGTEEADS